MSSPALQSRDRFRPGYEVMISETWGAWERLDGWCDDIANRVIGWQAPTGVRVDVKALARCIQYAATRRERWLYHPCLAALTLAGANRAENAVNMILWTAAHCDVSLGELELAYDIWSWAPAGGRSIDAGKYDVTTLAPAIISIETPTRWALDPWADTIGHPYPIGFPYSETWCWHSELPLDADQEIQLRTEIQAMHRSLSIFHKRLPMIADWVAAVTKVIIPIHKPRETTFKSGSLSSLAGTVFIEARDNQVLFLESLVHESAHLYFYLAEAIEPLVDAAHEVMYVSPLRPDPRPLRGIFLAYHALAHMCAYYESLAVAEISPECTNELVSMRRRRDAALEILWKERPHLTAAGRDMLDRTKGIIAGRVV